MTDATVELAVPVAQSDHIKGPFDARLTLVEYGDYECPDCTATFPMIEKLLAEAGDRVRFVFRHFPLSNIHKRASVAAQAAEAAAAQGKFWEMHELLYHRRGGLEIDDLDHMAIRLGMEVYRFQSELTTSAWASKVQFHADGGRQSGVTGTPTFFFNGKRLSASESTPDTLHARIARN